MKRPILYQGQRLPFDQLSPGQFELFTFAAFDTALGQRNNLRITTKPPEGSDDGFDARAIRITDEKPACLQAKRYQELTVPLIGFELAKVALQSAIDEEPIFSHLIVGASAMQKKLVTALGQSDQKTLIDRAIQDATSHEDLKIRREKVRSMKLDPSKLVEQHFERIGCPEVWSGEMLDQKIGACFSELADVVARYFTIHVVLQQHPRPDFSERAYLERNATFSGPWLDVEAERSKLPTNVYCEPPSPLASEPATSGSVQLTRLLESLENAPSILLTAPGGGGKTTFLSWLRAEVSRTCIDDGAGPLPILVSLGSYRGAIDDQITSALRIRGGSWLSIPGPKLVLLDGLDRVRRAYLPALADELDNLLGEPDVRLVLTCRSGGPFFKARIPQGFSSLTIQPPSSQAIVELAKRELGEAAADFLSQLWDAARTPGLLRIPFGVVAALEIFKARKALPSTDTELMERLIEERFTANERRHSSLPEPLAEVPTETVRKVASAFAFVLRVNRGRSTSTIDELSELVQESLANVSSSAIGIDRIDSAAAVRLLEHYEILEHSPDNFWQFPHDLYADYLSAGVLAKDWRVAAATLTSESYDDLWSFAAAKVDKPSQEDFLDSMAVADPVRGARCARACGQVEYVESKIAALADSSDLYYECNRVATALETLGTNSANRLLRSLAERGRSQNSRWSATLALARTGDPQIVTKSLEDTDSHLCSGIGIDGSWAYVLKHCAPGRLLEAARSRVSNPEKHRCLTASLEVVATYGTEDDIDSIRTAVSKAQNLSGLIEGMRALATLSPKAATNYAAFLFDEETSPRWVKISMAGLLIREDAFRDGPALAQLLLSNGGEDDPNEQLLQRVELEKLLTRMAPDAATAAALEAGLEGADDDLKGRLFRIAATHGYRFFVEPARDLLKSEDSASSRSDALSYLLAVARDRDELERLAEVVADLRNPFGPPEDTWVLLTVLKFVRRIEGSSAAVSLLKTRIEHVLDQIAVANEKRVGGFWAMSLSPLVDLIAERVPEMPLLLCARVLDTQFMHGLTNANALMERLVQSHPASEIDDALATMRDDFNKARFLAIAARHETTPFRCSELLRQLERPLLAILAKDLATALDHLWDDGLLGEVIDRIIRFNSGDSPPELALAHARPLLDCFARRVNDGHVQMLSDLAARSDCPAVLSSELRNLASAAKRRGLVDRFPRTAP